MLDIDYLRKRLCGTTGIPPDYLGFSDSPGSFAADIPLSFQDVNFARKEKRLQRGLMEGFVQLVMINLCWLGVDPFAESSEFTIHMGPVSSTDERQMLEVEKIRADTIAVLIDIGNQLGIDTPEWHDYLLKRSGIPAHIIRREPGEISKIIKGQVAVTERKSVYEKIDNQLVELLKGDESQEKKAILDRFFRHGKRIFGPDVGSNKLSSRSVGVSEFTFPYIFSDEESKDGKLMEGMSSIIREDTQKVVIIKRDNRKIWMENGHAEKAEEAKNLMTETIKQIHKEEQERIQKEKDNPETLGQKISKSL